MKCSGEHPLSDLCHLAGVSVSGYYKWYARKDLPQKDHQEILLVKKLFLQGKKKWGWRTIRMKLEHRGITMNHKKIQRIMKQHNLVTRIRKRNPYKDIMKKNLEHRTAQNVLNREFSVKTPYRVLCTDITYMKFNHRFVYLSTIKDICSGQIIAWYVDHHLHLPLVLKTVGQLSNKDLNGVLLHSDQGWHYTHPAYIKQLLDLNITQSMSRKGNCIDNAPMESFFGHFKDEIDYLDCKSFEDLRKKVDEYMYYYNHERPQWNKNKMTPIQYRDHMLSLI